MQKEFTAQAEKVLMAAKSLARKWGHPYVGTEHLLLALRKEFTGVASQILALHSVDEEKIIKIIEELGAPVQTEKSKKMEYSPRLEFLLDNAMAEAIRLSSEKIGTEHMLLSMVKDIDCVATRILATLNVDLSVVQKDILHVAGVDLKEYEDGMAGGRAQGGMLEQFGNDLTTQAAEGKLDPVVGREAEIERLMQVLSRRTKNNPCMIGEPGVGKTAIIEGLASRIAEGIVPEGMREKRI